MSRILARVLGVHAGPEPVRPRLPSLFEPGLDMVTGPGLPAGEPEAAEPETAGRETAGRETAGRETAGRETAGRETAGRETAGRETVRQLDIAAPGPAAGGLSGGDVAMRDISPAARPNDPLEPVRSVPEPPSARPGSPGMRPAPGHQPPSVPPPVPRPGHPVRPASALPRLAEPPAPQPRLPGSTAGPVAPVRPADRAPAAAAHREPTRRRQLPELSPAPGGRPGWPAPRRAVPRPVQDPAGAEPAVHITIGQVEIRADRAAEPPGRTPGAPAPPGGPGPFGLPAAARWAAMSDARAIEAVTETLRGIVDAGVKRVAAGARATTLPPHDITPSQELRVNVFLYQAEIDGALRNTDPVNVAPGEGGQPALPLILHYLITPYAPDADDVQAHRLLGGALQALHSHPLLTPTDLADAAPYSDIAHQVESVRVCWQPLDDKDIYSLWSIFQAPYRISTAFELRVVLIDSMFPGRAPLPVLTRGSTGRGPVVTASVGYPEITAVIPPLGQPSAVPGEQVSLLGAGLSAAAVTVLLNHPVLTAPMRIDPDSATGSEVKFTVPAAVPAGFGTVSLALSTPGISDLLSNDVPLGVSPKITSPLPATVAAARPGGRVRRHLQPHRTSRSAGRLAARRQPRDGAAGHRRHHGPHVHGRSGAGRDVPAAAADRRCREPADPRPDRDSPRLRQPAIGDGDPMTETGTRSGWLAANASGIIL